MDLGERAAFFLRFLAQRCDRVALLLGPSSKLVAKPRRRKTLCVSSFFAFWRFRAFPLSWLPAPFSAPPFSPVGRVGTVFDRQSGRSRFSSRAYYLEHFFGVAFFWIVARGTFSWGRYLLSLENPIFIRGMVTFSAGENWLPPSPIFSYDPPASWPLERSACLFLQGCGTLSLLGASSLPYQGC